MSTQTEREALAARLADYQRDERGRNLAEVVYWRQQYKQLAADAIAALQAKPEPFGMHVKQSEWVTLSPAAQDKLREIGKRVNDNMREHNKAQAEATEKIKDVRLLAKPEPGCVDEAMRLADTWRGGAMHPSRDPRACEDSDRAKEALRAYLTAHMAPAASAQPLSDVSEEISLVLTDPDSVLSDGARRALQFALSVVMAVPINEGAQASTVGPLPVAPSPFTGAQIKRLWRNSPELHGRCTFVAFEDVVKLVESAHDIGAAAQGEKPWKPLTDHAQAEALLAARDARIAVLEKDAARYLWLKTNKAHLVPEFLGNWAFWTSPLLQGETLDAAIDAAQQAQETKP